MLRQLNSEDGCFQEFFMIFFFDITKHYSCTVGPAKLQGCQRLERSNYNFSDSAILFAISINIYHLTPLTTSVIDKNDKI